MSINTDVYNLLAKMPQNPIFLTQAGSRLYGTNTPMSDLDVRGVALETKANLFGLSNFEQYEYNDKVGLDIVVYGLKKFVHLAMGQNPNIVELLFAENDFHNNYWEMLVDVRSSFLSRKAADTFVGYAVSQLKRMETHQRWMTDNPPEKPDPYNYGYTTDDMGNHKWASVDLKNQYDNKLKAFQQYSTWKENRNAKRHQLEVDFGYDTKNAMHLVRLLQEGEELLKTGFLTLPRPNKQELLDIREGSMSYNDVVAFMEAKKTELNILAETSVLPRNPDYAKVEEQVMDIYQEYVWDMVYD